MLSGQDHEYMMRILHIFWRDLSGMTGVPGIGENVIPCYKGIYSLNGNNLTVYYTAEEIHGFF